MKLKTHGRYDYSALPERKDYSWPGGKRLALLITTNVEWFAFGAGLGVGLLVARSINARSRRSRLVEPIMNALSTLTYNLIR